MNLEKALSILGLSRTYTEEDLKRTYRKLIAKYHPDLYESKSENEKKFAEEKTKDINTAKELLEKRLKDKTSTNFRSTTRSNYKTSSNAANQRYQTYTYMSELRKRKMELRKEIVDILDEINNIADNNDELLKHIKNQLQTSLGLFKNIIDIVNSVSELSDMQSKIYTKIINILNNYAKDYCKKHNITVDINTLENKSLKKLQEQLEELRKKKEEETRNIKILEEEFYKYTLFTGFSILEKVIIDFKDKIEKDYTDGKLNSDDAILKFNNMVLEEFKNYYKRLEFLNKLKKLLANGNFPGYYDMLIEDLEKNVANRSYFWSKAYNYLDAFNQRERTGGTDEITKEEKNRINNNKFESVNEKNYIIKDYNVDKIFSKKKNIKKNI